MKQKKRSVIRHPNAEGMRLTARECCTQTPAITENIEIVYALHRTEFVIEEGLPCAAIALYSSLLLSCASCVAVKGAAGSAPEFPQIIEWRLFMLIPARQKTWRPLAYT